MDGIAYRLDRTLTGLDATSAAALKRLVEDAIILAARNDTGFHGIDAVAADTSDAELSAVMQNPADSWPTDYFEKTAGAFASEPFDLPDDPPASANPHW